MERWHLRERQCCKPGVGNEGPALLLVGNPDGGLKVGRLLWTVLHPLLFCCRVFGLLLLHLLLLRIFTAPSLVTSHPFSFNHCLAPTRVLLDNCNWVPAFKCRRCCSAASLDDQQEASAQNNENWKKKHNSSFTWTSVAREEISRKNCELTLGRTVKEDYSRTVKEDYSRTFEEGLF